MTDVLTARTDAERARTLLAGAATARLRTGCRLLATAVTAADVEEVGDRTLLVRVPTGSAATEGLGACRVGTLEVISTDPVRSLRLVASFRMERPDGSKWQAFRATVLSVRLAGALETAVDVEQFWRARPDPLAGDARRVQAHLEAAHASELLTAVRARGHAADVVTVQSVDSRGVVVSVLDADGVAPLRIDLDRGAVSDVAGLLGGLPLTCDCHL